MPSFSAQTSKATTRQAVADVDRIQGTTSGAGNAGGTTAVASAFIGRQVDFFRGKYLLLTSGTYSGQWREITNFASSTGTFTVATAYGGQVATSVTFEVYSIPLHLFTVGGNEAIQWCYPNCYRLIRGHARARGDVWYGMPRNMDGAHEALISTQKIKDLFNRANSATSPGSGWTVVSGDTFGVTGELLYSVTDTNADMMTRDVDLRNGIIEVPLTGTTNHETVYRTWSLMFRVAEDRNGDVDVTNFLAVRLIGTGTYVASPLAGGRVELRKNDGGTESVLASAGHTSVNGTYYLVRVEFLGTRINVYVDGVQLISYELLGTDLKYLDNPQVGIRLDLAGSPATAARIREYWAFNEPTMEWSDVRENQERTAIRLAGAGQNIVAAGNLVTFIGRTYLTALDADTTYGTLTNDSTTVLEIATTDPAWPLLVEYCRWRVWDKATDPSVLGNPLVVQEYVRRRDKAMQDIRRLAYLAMPIPLPFRGPVW